jgi:hypothetical protein
VQRIRVTTAPARSRSASSGTRPGTSPGAPSTWRWASTARVACSIAASRWTCRPWAPLPRSVLPSTATAPPSMLPPRVARVGHRRPATRRLTAASAVGSTRARVRRVVASVGTPSGRGRHGERRTPPPPAGGASAAHSAIAATDRAPVSTAAAAMAEIATRGWRRPLARLGSWMVASRRAGAVARPVGAGRRGRAGPGRRGSRMLGRQARASIMVMRL